MEQETSRRGFLGASGIALAAARLSAYQQRPGDKQSDKQLFAYVGLLDLATLVLVIYKPWRRLLVMSFTGTLLLYLGWYSSFYSRIYLDLTATFATFFFAVFAVAPLVGRREAAAPDFPRSPVSSLIPHLIAFANAVVYFLQVFVMLQEVDKTASAWFALALAGVYIFLSRQVRARYSDPQVIETLHFLHLALALGFITIAIPIRLDGHWITMGWFVEAGILLWVADRIKSDFLNLFAIGALVLGVARLLLIDDFYVTDLMFNWRITTHIVAIAVLAMIAWYGSQREDETGQQASRLAIISINVLALEALSREVIDYFSRQFSAVSVPGRWNPGETDRLRDLEIARHFTFSALWMGYGAMLMIIGFWRRSSFVRWQALVLIAATIFKVFTSDVWQLDRGYRVISFIVLGVLLLAISFGYQRDWLKLSANQPERESPKS